MNDWWTNFLKFWPVIIIGGGAVISAWGMIIEARYDRKDLREAVDEMKNDKVGYRKQWEILSDLKERTLKLEFQRENDERRLEALERQ